MTGSHTQPQTALRAVLLVAGLLAILAPARLLAWGEMHARITEAAFDALPEWQRQIMAAQRTTLIEFDCMIPDLVRAPSNRKTLGRFAVLPNGDSFTHEPHSRHHNVAQMLHYFEQAVQHIRASELDEASRYAGCLLHFLEDCGSPAHSIPGDNQHGLMKDLIPVPEAFRDLPLHGLIEGGSLKIDLTGYHPQLLGTTSGEAVSNLVERFNTMIRNARSQLIPILQGVFQNSQDGIDKGRLRAATMDAQVAADALYTIFSIAKDRFEAEDKARLESVDVSSLTPLEVISQSYFPQNTYFSNPYFGYPVRNGILEGGKQKQPLVLNVIENGKTNLQRFEQGVGLGTHSRLTYALPAKVYDRFECLVGLHALLGKGGSVSFRVYADGEAVFDSGMMTGEDPAKQVSLPVWRVDEISMDVQSQNATPGSNYAVIARPTLSKAKAPPQFDQDKVR